MKNTAIVTITNSGLNFGNRLQNYALQHSVTNVGAPCSTIVSAKRLGNVFTSALRRKVKHLVKRDARRKKFQAFEQKYLRYDPLIRYEGLNENEFDARYECFLAGSDQVWNPNFHFNSDFEYLTFASPEKRCSYAASFGVSEIPAEKKTFVTEGLNGMHTISVREDRAADMVKELTGREAQVHMDPVFLLTKDDWHAVAKAPDQPLPKRYLLQYFLGYKTKEHEEQILSICEREQLTRISLSETPGDLFYGLGPDEFVYLIENAAYVCTDSFHGASFSLIFEKPLVPLTRVDSEIPMNARIETLYRHFALSKDASYDPAVLRERKTAERERGLAYLRGVLS